MRTFPFLLMSLSLVLASCDNEELRQLQSENDELSSTVDQLEAQVEDLTYQLHQRENYYEDKLGSCEKQFDEYKYGEGYTLGRMTPTGKVLVYGAENIIEFLNQHYCTHWEWEISREAIARSKQNPRIIR